MPPAPAPRHRARPRLRYGRLAAATATAAVVGIALLGGTGALRGDDRDEAAADAPATTPAAAPAPSTSPSPRASTSPAGPAGRVEPVEAVEAVDPTALPAASGTGRRIVFDQSAQRVWLVDRNGVERTYLGSGSVLDNLHPGSYAVYSRSRWAVGVDDSGVMQYFVRFTQGPQGAAIGFHTIPTKNGTPLQSVAQLGTPRSHGCIRQRTADAIALWEFAPVGTKVVVVA